MAVVSVTTLSVKPDGFEDALADVRQVKALMEKNGATNVRLLAALVAGEATGSLAFTYEADDFASQGGVQDKFFADPEGMALMAKASSSASPNASYQSTFWVDVPL